MLPWKNGIYAMNEPEMPGDTMPGRCQPIGCDAGFHVPGCYFEKEDQMVAKSTPAKVESEFIADADVTTSPEEWEWETVAEGAALRVVFDTIGDTFVGKYLGKEHIDREPAANGEDQSFDLFNFRGRDGELYAINVSYALEDAMQKVQPEDWCRITYIKDVPTSRKQNDMKDFRVDVRRK